jgi:hypothetical protein
LTLQIWNANLLCTEQLGAVVIDLWHVDIQNLAGLPSWFDLDSEGSVQCTVSFEQHEVTTACAARLVFFSRPCLLPMLQEELEPEAEADFPGHFYFGDGGE